MSNSEITAQEDAGEKLQEQEPEETLPVSNSREKTNAGDFPGEHTFSEISSAVSSAYSSVKHLTSHKAYDTLSCFVAHWFFPQRH